MIKLKLVKQMLFIAFPILLSNLFVIGASIVNARIVAYDNINNWYLLGLYLPISYIVLGFLEAGRVSSIMGINSSAESKVNFNRVILTAGFYSFSLIGLSLLMLALYIVNINIFYVSQHLFREFSFFSSLLLLGYVPVLVNSVFNAGLFGSGRSREAFFVIAFSSMLSVAVTFFLNNYFKMGIYSLVLGTFFPYSIGTLVSLFFINKDKHSLISKNLFSNVRYCLSRIYDTGLPILLSYSLMPIFLYFMNYLLSFLGVNVVSGFSIAYRIQTFFIVLAISLGVSTGILFNRKISSYGREVFGFNLALLVFLLYIPLAIILFSFKKEIVLIFTQDPLVQVVVENYINSFFIPYVIFCPVLAILCFFEQTGFAFKSFFANSMVLVIQLISGIIYLQYSKISSGFFSLMALVCFISSLFLIVYFYWMSRNKFNLTLSNGRNL